LILQLVSSSSILAPFCSRNVPFPSNSHENGKANKMCLYETYSSVQLGSNLSETIASRNGLRQGDVLPPLLFNCDLEYAITRVQINQSCLILNDTNEISVCIDGVNIGWKCKYYKVKRRSFVSD
jgi:hypothetical protein